MTSVVSAITGREGEFTKAGESSGKAVESGMKSKSNAISKAFTKGLSMAVRSIRSRYKYFYNAGKYLVEGFAKGISANTWRAEAKSKAMH